MSTVATVFVVDDDASVRRSLERLLLSDGLAVRSFGSAEEFLSTARVDGPSCLVLDLRMPGIGGLDLQQELQAAGLDQAIVFVSAYGSVPATVRAMRAGAVDFLQKPFDDDQLLGAIHRALARDASERAARGERKEIEASFQELTPREREVLALVVTGLPNRLVADRLGTSEKTIKVHRGRVMAKMGARSLAHLVRLAQKIGIDGGAR
jgi:FixJ family two-component response regulator